MPDLRWPAHAIIRPIEHVDNVLGNKVSGAWV